MHHVGCDTWKISVKCKWKPASGWRARSSSDGNFEKFLSARSQPDKSELLKVLRWANVKLQWLLIEAVLTHGVLGPASHSLLWRKLACWEKNLIIKIATRVVPGPPPGDGIKKILHNFIQLLPAFTKYFWLLFHPIIFVESSCEL